MTQVVRLADLAFNWDSDDLGKWICEDLQGWYSSAPMRGGSRDLPAGNGSSESSKNYRSARPLLFIGHVKSHSKAVAREQMFDAFAAIQADGAPFELSVENEFGKRTLQVTLDGSAIVKPHRFLLGAYVEAALIAYDPIKYGELRSPSTGLPTSGGGLEYNLGAPSGALYYGTNGNLGRLTLSNAGTAEVWPVFVVTGELSSGFFIQRLDTGQMVRYDRVVPAGSSVRIDFRTGEVLVDDISDGSTYLTRYDFFSVQRGESYEVQFNAIGGSSGSPQMAGLHGDGYW